MTEWLPVARDVSNHRNSVEALGQTQEQFSNAFIEAEIGMALVALDGRWLQVNRALCEIVGYSEDELTATNFQVITHPDDLEADMALAHRLLSGEIPNYRMEKRYLHKEGHVVWILLVQSLVRDTQGTPLYFIAQIKNITERKKTEEALRESEEQLRYALDERKRLSQDLHDNVIQVLMACGLGLEGLRRIIKRDPKEAVSEITRVISELNLVIEDIRHYIVGIDPVLRFSPAQFRASLRRITRAFTGSKSLRFRVRLTPSVVSQLTPEQAKHLLFIAQEAVSNSVRHGRARMIAMSLQRHKGGARLAVKDDGAGFNPRVARNTGSGLRNMTLRAERLKGRFQLVSKRRQGTQIFVDLPAAAIGERTVR